MDEELLEVLAEDISEDSLSDNDIDRILGIEDTSELFDDEEALEEITEEEIAIPVKKPTNKHKKKEKKEEVSKKSEEVSDDAFIHTGVKAYKSDSLKESDCEEPEPTKETVTYQFRLERENIDMVFPNGEFSKRLAPNMGVFDSRSEASVLNQVTSKVTVYTDNYAPRFREAYASEELKGNFQVKSELGTSLTREHSFTGKESGEETPNFDSKANQDVAQSQLQEEVRVNEEPIESQVEEPSDPINDNPTDENGFVHEKVLGQSTEPGNVEIKPFTVSNAYATYSERFGEMVIRLRPKRADNTISTAVDDFNRSETYWWAKNLLSGIGANSVAKHLEYQDRQFSKVCAEVERLVGKKVLSFEDFKDSSTLKGKISEISKEEAKKGAEKSKKTDIDTKETRISRELKRDIIKNRKEILDKFRIREEFLSHKDSYSREEIAFLGSKKFYKNDGVKTYGSILDKYLKAEGVRFLENNKISGMRYKDVERLAKGANSHGFTKDIQKKMLYEYSKRGKGSAIKKKAGRILGGNRKTLKIAGHIGEYILRSDSNYGLMYSRGRTIVLGFGITKRTIGISSTLLRQHYKKSLVGRITTKVIGTTKGLIKVSYDNSSLKKAVDKLKGGVKKAKDVAKATGKEVKKAVKKRFYEDTVIKKGFDKAKSGMKSVSTSLSKSKSVRFVKKAGKRTKTVALRAKGIVDRINNIIRTPFRFVGKFTDLLHGLKLKVIGILGGTVLTLFKLYNILLMFVMLLLSIDGILDTSGKSAKQMTDSYIEMIRSVINYENYADMRADINYMLSRDEERLQAAKEIGEGDPINPDVSNGYTIDHYGSPDKSSGYTIHFLDAYGNEMPSDSTNARDVEALCIAMISNDLGMYKGYSRDKRMLDDLIADMYELLTGSINYAETDIYHCNNGCYAFKYHCNRASDYQYYQDLIDNGAGFYEDLVPLKDEDDGCKEEEVWEEDWVWVEDWHYYDDVGWVDEGDFEVQGGYVLKRYCDFEHYVPLCVGHKDIDIYITMYDIEYAISHNIYPSDWSTKSYAPMIKQFMDKGAWTNEVYANYARKYYSGDWWQLYKIDVEGGAGFSTVSELTEEEIAAIMARLPEDLSEARKQLVEFALRAVGKIGYQWGGKASGSGWSAVFGSPTPDEKGRRNGLDCSGFTQWVFRSVLGVNIPGSTAGFSGYIQEDKAHLKVGDLGFYYTPGSEENHIGIYLGKDAAGNDTWVHCAGATGVTYGTGNFKYFINMLSY